MINLTKLHLTNNVRFGNVTEQPTKDSSYLGYHPTAKKELWATGEDKIELDKARKQVTDAQASAPKHPRMFGVIQTSHFEEAAKALEALKQNLFSRYQ